VSLAGCSDLTGNKKTSGNPVSKELPGTGKIIVKANHM